MNIYLIIAVSIFLSLTSAVIMYFIWLQYFRKRPVTKARPTPVKLDENIKGRLYKLVIVDDPETDEPVDPEKVKEFYRKWFTEEGRLKPDGLPVEDKPHGSADQNRRADPI